MLDHAADVMVRCTGENLEECFENAAYAMFDQIVDASKIDGTIERTVSVSADDDEERLYSFLSELLFIMDCVYIHIYIYRYVYLRSKTFLNIVCSPL